MKKILASVLLVITLFSCLVFFTVQADVIEKTEKTITVDWQVNYLKYYGDRDVVKTQYRKSGYYEGSTLPANAVTAVNVANDEAGQAKTVLTGLNNVVSTKDSNFILGENGTANWISSGYAAPSGAYYGKKCVHSGHREVGARTYEYKYYVITVN